MTVALLDDSKRRPIDPTHTAAIRKVFRSTAKLRLRMVRGQMRVAVVDKDILGLGPNSYHAPEVQLSAFRYWLDRTLCANFDGDWANKYIRAGHARGMADGIRDVGGAATSYRLSDDVTMLARSEVRGILEAVMQRMSRTASDVVVRRLSPRQAFQMLATAYDVVAEPRMVSMANTLVVRAYNQAKLEVYRQNRVTRVGTIPERPLPKPVIGDAEPYAGVIHNRPRVLRGKPMEFEPGMLMGVQTAGDDYVCQKCEDYSEDSPHLIEDVIGKIPLHPNCRCTVFPWPEELSAKHEVKDGVRQN